MGYMEISIVGSDMASDLNWSVGDLLKRKHRPPAEVIAHLRKELALRHGPYNTDGVVNVALVLTEGKGRMLRDDPGYPQLVTDATAALRKYIDDLSARKWPDSLRKSGRQIKEEHLGVFRHLLGRLKRCPR